MRVAEIKAELLERQIDFSDCFDKDGLADKLVKARAGLVQPRGVAVAPGGGGRAIPEGAIDGSINTPAGAAKGVEYGAETRLGEEDMDAAFKAAGWTGEQADSASVDTSRSPGMNRNFGSVSQSDFKKPYTRPRDR